MALRFSRTYRSLLRLKDIATVLTRHGLGQLVDMLNLRQHVPFLSRLHSLSPLGPDDGTDSLARRLVAAIEELGPTFIKFGQLLSGRPDILPELWIPEFRQLQDSIPPFDSSEARAMVESALGMPVDEAFRSFEATPLASGSIGQAHPAVLIDGTDVIVKVRRPGIERQILTDINLLANLAVLAERYIPEIRIIRPVVIIEEFARSIRKELDFVTEATYTGKFHDQLATIPGLRTPRVFWDLTTSEVLTIEKLPGQNIGDIPRLDQLGVDRTALASTLSAAFMRQYFETGLFHADPHPGNILVDDEGTIGLIDFGMVGHLSPTLKSQLASAVLAVLRGDLELVVQIYTDIGAFSAASDIEEAKGDLLELLDKYFGVPLHKINTMDVFTDLTRVARKNQIVLPRDFVLFGKSLVTIATLCRELDPKFSLASAAQPHLWPILKEKVSPLRLFNLGILHAWNWTSLIERLPGDLKQLLRQARRGELRTVHRHEGLDPLARSIERASSRVAIAVFTSGLIVGSSLLARQLESPYLALAGYISGSVLGLWLMVDVMRRR